jgi:ABC-type microcin C transport system permease subunit YejB
MYQYIVNRVLLVVPTLVGAAAVCTENLSSGVFVVKSAKDGV